MLSPVLRGRLMPRPVQLLRPRQQQQQQRWVTPAPCPGDGPLMTRRADRELPDVAQLRFRWTRSLPLFLGLVGVAALAIFNYQKTSSPVVAATLYALRTSPRARALLGDDIYFRRSVPWIRGSINQLRGHVDVAFAVRGSRAAATVRFVCRRPAPAAPYQILEWSLAMLDGSGLCVDLLEGAPHGPLGALLADDSDHMAHGGSPQQLIDEPGAVVEAVNHDALNHKVRGFRQQSHVQK